MGLDFRDTEQIGSRYASAWVRCDRNYRIEKTASAPECSIEPDGEFGRRRSPPVADGNAAETSSCSPVDGREYGHSDTRMVEKHYGHLAPSYIADAIRAGAPRFGFKPDPKLATLGG